MTSERERSWSGLLDATPPGWYVGTPVYHVERGEWAMYAFDTTEKARTGKRSREWTAVTLTEEGVVLDGAMLARHCGRHDRQVRRSAAS